MSKNIEINFTIGSFARKQLKQLDTPQISGQTLPVNSNKNKSVNKAGATRGVGTHIKDTPFGICA